jgi:hypothetical protein
MGITIYREPELFQPMAIAGWPGIGNIGLAAIDTLRGQIGAREFAEVEPWDFFYPSKVSIRDGLLEGLEFPGNKFYYQRLEKKDLVIFIGEEQPSGRQGTYVEGEKAYEMANLVLDVAEKFGCPRVYSSGACVLPTHHTMKPRVISVVSSEKLKEEVKNYPNTILISEAGRGDRGAITGLNGLLLTAASRRGLESICLMGEIPDWLAGAPSPYPKASKSVLEVFAHILGIRIDFSVIDEMTHRVEKAIGEMYEKFPLEIRERYDQRKLLTQVKPEVIAEEDAKWIKGHIDELFKKGKEDGEQPV